MPWPVAEGADTNDDADVIAEASFSLELDEASSTLSVDEGQAVEVAFTVENTGNADGTATVTLTLGEFTDTAEIAVAAGSAEGGSFTWMTAEGDAGTYSAEVVLGETTVTADVVVAGAPIIDEEGAFFELSIVTEASTLTVVEGESLEVVVLGTNTGTTEGIIELTGQITMEGGGIVGLQLQTEGGDAETPVAPGQGVRIEATLPTGPGEQELSAGTHSLEISSQHDSVTTEVVVTAPAE
ncbi:hypothetical protein FRC98_15720 [Lujinxingia vulgaris]|uniref:CARDB domain-containing protein n=1 Tax=Lujinxingia vulgaris TaxID=2600176 RepID=A0A5C6XA71_9DELT|nr:hypothetical protein [Lujinxingia vulgaris]TXD35653.1 hypothetical protein FRC98_15720 [Lujinxingia vulgaris]